MSDGCPDCQHALLVLRRRHRTARKEQPMNITLRVLFAVVAVICGIVVLIKAASNTALIATGIGLIAAGVGLVVP